MMKQVSIVIHSQKEQVQLGKLAAIEVKLNGVTANTKPSKALYSMVFFIPSGEYLGCCSNNFS